MPKKSSEQAIKSTLNKLSKTSHKYWSISPETGKFLNLLIRDRNYKTVLEIGTSNGYSAIWLAEGLSHTNGHLYTIESHKKERYQLAQENFKKSGLKNITSILGHAPEDIPKTPKKFDLAFFDATKHEHLDFFKALSHRIKPGGMIITDNILSHKKELTPYIKHLRSLPNWHSEILNIGTGLMVSLKLTS